MDDRLILKWDIPYKRKEDRYFGWPRCVWEDIFTWTRNRTFSYKIQLKKKNEKEEEKEEEEEEEEEEKKKKKKNSK
jgi:hypothetical protein